MELQEFISASIEQLIDGIVDAQSVAEGKSAFVNPSGLNFKSSDFPMFRVDDHSATTIVEFDIALTAIESDTKKGNAGIKLAIFSLGGQLDSKESSQAVHRLKFKLPIHMPTQPFKSA